MSVSVAGSITIPYCGTIITIMITTDRHRPGFARHLEHAHLEHARQERAHRVVDRLRHDRYQRDHRSIDQRRVGDKIDHSF